MKKFLFTFLVASFFFSCQKVLELDAETTTPKIVVNSLFSTNQEWSVNVSKSSNVLENQFLEDIPNATVTILDENDNLIHALVYNGFDGFVGSSPVFPSPNQRYKVNVSAPGFRSVSASDFSPLAVPIVRLDTSSGISTSSGEIEKSITVTFQDPGSTDNYYGLELDLERYLRTFNSSTGEYDTAFLYTQSVNISSTNPSLDNGGGDGFLTTLNFTDNLFDGRQQSIKISYFSYETFTPEEFWVRKVRLLSLSESSYKFSKTYAAYLNSSGNPFAEPIQVFTNVSNGFGIFGGQSISEIKL